MPEELEHLNQPILPHARRDFAQLRQDFTVQQALEAIRVQGVGEKLVYFYVVDDRQSLVGVLPTRRLLTSPLEQRLAQIMITRVLAIPHTATILEACELFVLHRFLAFPVVDEQRRILGIVDVNLFTQEVLDIGEREQTDEVFEALVGLIVGAWRGEWLAASVIGASVALSLIAACLFGLSVPALLHTLRLDPKIAAGPVTLALTDIFTLLCYFGLAALVL